MKILVTGASGLVGSALVPSLTAAGHAVLRLTRGGASAKGGEVSWDPERGQVDTQPLEGLDGVVHLAGENIAEGRWTPEKKARIRDSRVRGTRLLCEALARLTRPPAVLVSASAVGYYGDRGDEELTEQSPPGSGFLAEVCQQWEAAAAPAREKGIRVVHPRIGMVLSARGGALAKMLFPFRMGVGGVVGTGQQYISWITLEDLVGVIQYCLNTESLSGPINAVASNPVTNHEFTKALGRALGRPTFLPMPAFAARLAFGEMADQLLLASARVKPARLLAAGYGFRHPEIDAALKQILSR